MDEQAKPSSVRLHNAPFPRLDLSNLQLTLFSNSEKSNKIRVMMVSQIDVSDGHIHTETYLIKCNSLVPQKGW